MRADALGVGAPLARERSTTSLFAAFAAGSLVLVVLLGIVLGLSYRAEAERRGVAEGLSEAQLLSSTSVAPLLDGRPLSSGLSAAQRAQFTALSRRVLAHRDLLRLRLRDTAGRVVFSVDGSGMGDAPDDEAVEAAEGEAKATLTRVNSDSVDSGAIGEDAVEVYLPLEVGDRTVGVLETYLPYAPIDADVSAGMRSLYVVLAAGLAALYLGVFGLSVAMSRGLRRQIRVNRHLAEHDTLTDLPNRTTFLEHVDAAVHAGERSGSPVVVALLDLDRFKEVNDTLGHDSGDALLAEVARRLTGQLRDADSVARLGGDEFGLVLRDATDPERALWRVREVLGEDLVVAGVPLTVDASIGFVVAPDDGLDAALLLQRADVAMYVAKGRHAGVMRYDAAADHYDAGNLALVSEIRRAIDVDELVLHYQPKVRSDDQTVVSLEALVRWQHPTRGLLGPDRFVPLLEQTDLIEAMTQWVLDRALHDLASLSQTELTVAVNVSARSLARDGLADQVRDSLVRAGVDPQRLVVEITETALLVDPARAATVLFAVTDLGVAVSLDDFGVGQTSLSHLATLPIHELKIDRSFVRDLPDNATHLAIARSIADLGQGLGLDVVAEGVETDQVAEEMRAVGCTQLQGYLIARPMPLSALQDWLSAHVPMATPH